MSLKILSTGILDTLQDGGRYGYRYLGINPGGCMDPYSARIANLLAGNDEGEATIEMHYPASSIEFTCTTLIAISGGGFSPVINGRPVPVLQPVLVFEKEVLHFTSPAGGARTYLAVNGGFCLENWLGSESTHLKLFYGGFKGRKLMKGDKLKVNENIFEKANYKASPFSVLPWKIMPQPVDDSIIGVLKGREWEQLSEPSQQLFIEQAFRITARSDRMGYYLNGRDLNKKVELEMVSAAVNAGTVQLLPNGQLIVLMADHPTTGGYPKLAHISSAHLGKLAQMKPGDIFHFKFISQEEAEKQALKKNRYLQQLKISCTSRLQEWVKKNINK